MPGPALLLIAAASPILAQEADGQRFDKLRSVVRDKDMRVHGVCPGRPPHILRVVVNGRLVAPIASTEERLSSMINSPGGDCLDVHQSSARDLPAQRFWPPLNQSCQTTA